MRNRSLLLALLLPLTLAACSEPEDTRPGKPVAHRQQAFLQILKAFEPMGLMLRKRQYNADAFIKLAAQLDATKEGPWTYFQPDTDYPPTKATPKVWSEGEKFQTRRQEFLNASTALVQAAQTRDETQVRSAYEALHETCRSCHKDFKK